MFCKNNKKKPEAKDDLFSNIKPLLVVGRLLFFFPCDGFSWESHHNFIFRRNSFPTAIAFLIITWYIVKDIISLKFLIEISHGGVVGYAHPMHYFIVSGVITFFYIYCFKNSFKLKQLFENWEKAATTLHLKAFSLRRVTWLALLSMIPQLMVNCLFAIDTIHRLDGRERKLPENFTTLEYPYQRLMKNWHSIVPFSPQFTIAALADFVYGALTRGFVFPLVITFSYALSSQFKHLYEVGLERVNKSRSNDDKEDDDEGGFNKVRPAKKDNSDEEEEKSFWNDLVKRHNGLTELVIEFDDYLSPIIFLTYVLSLYLICLQLLRALSSSMDQAEAELTLGLSPFIYQASFSIETCILYIMSISAAQINNYSHKIRNVLKRCPSEYHTPEITRLENRVNFGPQIGFTGLGCFVITKPFLLTLANAVITLEIVLLSAQISNPPVFESELPFQ